MDITIKPLSPDLLDDYLFFFDNLVFTENPNWESCYCYSFHFTGADDEWNKESNRAAVIQLIKEKKMRGYLAYSEGKPVGWCNANNRLNYQGLKDHYELADPLNEKICSIVCFVISPGFRRQGIAKKLLRQICDDHAASGYEYLEAYPAKGDLSAERHYRGPLSLYEKFGFEVIKEYEKYYLVRKKCK